MSVDRLLGSVYLGFTEAVKDEIACGVDVEGDDDKGNFALFVAAEENHLSVVEVLLEAKANVNQQNLTTGESSLHAAARRGHFSVVSCLVQKDATIDIRDFDKSTPLYSACKIGCTSVVRMLLEHGADPCAARFDSHFPLYVAAHSGFVDVVDALLDYKADVHRTLDSSEECALYAAVTNGHATTVQLLLEKGKATVGQANRYGVPPILVAASLGDGVIVDMLIKHGAELNNVYKLNEAWLNKTGETLLIAAIKKCATDVVIMLLEHGADPNLAYHQNSTPVAWAAVCENGDATILAALIKHGANVNPCVSEGVATPLVMAMQDDSPEIVRLLVRHGAEIDLKLGDTTPLVWSISTGLSDIASILIEHNADVNHVFPGGETALHVACATGDLEICLKLLQRGVKLDLLDQYGDTALLRAIKEGYWHISLALIQHGADVNLCDSSFCSPLILASKQGVLDVVVCLIDAGADVNKQTDALFTALMYATYIERVDIVETLIGADNLMVNVRGPHGFTALSFACQKKQLSVVRSLLQIGAQVNCETDDGRRPLTVAAQFGFADGVHQLLEHGALVNVTTPRQNTSSLHSACKQDDVRMLKTLLAHGADINIVHKRRGTPLLTCVEVNHNTCVRLLLQHSLKFSSDCVPLGGDVHMYESERALRMFQQ